MKKQKDNVQVPQSGQIAVNTKEHSLLRHIKKEWRLYSLMIIPLLYYIIITFGILLYLAATIADLKVNFYV